MGESGNEWIMKALDTILHKVGKVDLLIETQQKQERLLERMAEAVTKLSVIETQQNNDRAALERAFNALAAAEQRIESERAERNAGIEKVVTRLEAVMQKLHTRIDEVEGRTDTLEKAAPQTALTTQWVQNAMWAAASFAVYLIVSKLGLIG